MGGAPSISSQSMPPAQTARLLPSVDELLRVPALAEAEAQLGHDIALRAARRVLAERREQLFPSGSRDSHPHPNPLPVLRGRRIAGEGIALLAEAAARIAWQTVTPSLRNVINA